LVIAGIRHYLLAYGILILSYFIDGCPMFKKVWQSIFPSRNARLLASYNKLVLKINKQEEELKTLSLEALPERLALLKKRVQGGESLDAVLVETFALVREAARRVLKQRHYDVQLLGGIALHQGKVAEMGTGEGKTQVALLPAVLNALAGSVHIVTVNDYLVRRDAQWMGPVYEALGLEVGMVVADMPQKDKSEAYKKDIVYATNNELGFDYLRDKMVHSAEERVQGELTYAIVDEVDSILIDEARTPLVISGSSEDSSELYRQINTLMPLFTPEDYTVEEKSRQVHLSEIGHQHAEQHLRDSGLLAEDASLYDPQYIAFVHHLSTALRAHYMYKKNVDYLVAEKQVMIVDEHTGRALAGRRWSDGLHQAIEAKEGVPIQAENQTLASITFQNFFRLYQKLAGMTGTADTEAYELQQIYGLEVTVIPPHLPSRRQDWSDLVYINIAEKFEAILNSIDHCVKETRPVLVGTVSIEVSEYLSELLKKKGIQHQVLNAKFHEQEAQIIAQAGRLGAITIATNMAGRGTDIVLGGRFQEGDDREAWQAAHDKVVALGGLHILGTERHESRRIDNQLRGRSGRQGDPGSTQFFLSLEDTLMRRFAADRMQGMMRTLGLKTGEAIAHPFITRAIERAQRKVEAFNFDMRKQLLDYDNVANDQRSAFYQQRDLLLDTEDLSELVEGMRTAVVKRVVGLFVDEKEGRWAISDLQAYLLKEYGLTVNLDALDALDPENRPSIHHVSLPITDAIVQIMMDKEREYGADVMRRVEKDILLYVLDHTWKEHLCAMDHLRQSIHLRGYAQKDPRQEYKKEAFTLFSHLLDRIKEDVLKALLHVRLNEKTPSKAEVPSLPRNAFCPCGSGKRYKSCHGSLVES
jgi:preprotein translocase subunit SecA